MRILNPVNHTRQSLLYQGTDFSFLPVSSTRYIILLLAILIFALVHSSTAATQQEEHDFKTALSLFKDGFWAQSEKAFADFASAHTNSMFLSQALLYQGISRFNQRNFTGAIELLEKKLNSAGELTDEYLFWIAESHFNNTNYPSAAQFYARIINQFQKSKRFLESVYRKALCHHNLNQFQEVIQLLGASNSIFQTQSPTEINQIILRGKLLLADTYLILNLPQESDKILKTIPANTLKDDLLWQFTFLKCKTLIGNKRLDEALSLSSNLLQQAESTQNKEVIAQSVFLTADINEKLGDKKNVITTYEKYLSLLPPPQRRSALLKIVDLYIGLNLISEATTRLETYINTYTNDSALDVCLLTLGELKLKEYWLYIQQLRTNNLIPSPQASNLLKSAITHLNRIIADFPNSKLLPKAHLQRGWCLWLNGELEQSQLSFNFAAENLPPSEDQAVARFKLGDIAFQLGNYTNAITHYKTLITNYINNTTIKNLLLDQAFYQLLNASIIATNILSAEQAVSGILTNFPDSFYSQKSLLLYGQALNKIDTPAKARAVLESFIKRFPNSILIPEVQIAIAKTYIQERNFPTAIKYYDNWYVSYSTNNPKPEAEFDRGWTYYQAGFETNALNIFTNFISKYPNNPLSAEALFWIGNYYYKIGNFTNAEAQFQLLFQNTNWQTSLIGYQAKMMAGKAAFARQGFKDAGDYFKSLINDEKCPPDIVVEACFALGDTLIEEGSADPTKKLQQFNDAIVVFNKIPQIFPTNRCVPAALGRIADCYLQLASENPDNYQRAEELYRKVVNSDADISVRSKAEVGLGLVLEKVALLKPQEKDKLLNEALEHYLNVVYARNVRTQKNESPDPFWIKRAGLSAIAILEKMQSQKQLIALCERLKTILPAMTDYWDKKIKSATAPSTLPQLTQ